MLWHERCVCSGAGGARGDDKAGGCGAAEHALLVWVDSGLLLSVRWGKERPPAQRSPHMMPAALHPGHLRRRAAQLVVAIGVTGLVVATLPGLHGARAHLQDAQPVWLIVAAVIEIASALSYVVVLRAVFCPCMRWGPSYQLGMSELAADSLLPAGGAGGLALGAWALHRGGMSSGHITRRTVAFFLLTSAANFAVVIGAGIGAGLGILPGRTTAALTLLPAALAAAAVAAVVLLPRLLDRAGAVSGSPLPAHTARARMRGFAVRACRSAGDGLRDALSLLGSGRTLVIAGSLGYLAFDIAALGACFAATGGVPPLGDLVLAYTIGQLGGLIPLPGGVGGTDGGLIGMFVLYGAPIGSVTAAVLLYRLVQLGVPALLGLPAFVQLRRRLRRPEGFAAICEPLADETLTAQT